MLIKQTLDCPPRITIEMGREEFRWLYLLVTNYRNDKSILLDEFADNTFQTIQEFYRTHQSH